MTLSASQAPLNTVVRITDIIGGKAYQGSGVLIAPDEVLTSSHLVYTEGVGVATSIVVTPGATAAGAPFGTATGAYVHYASIDNQGGVISSDEAQSDYAVIHLSQPFTSLGFMGLQANFAGGAVDIAGYPAASGGQVVDSMQTVTGSTRYSLLSGVSVGPGGSGGPVWVGGPANPQVVGIVSSDGAANSPAVVTQLSTEALLRIQAWVALDTGAVPAVSGVFSGTADAIGAEFDTLEAEARAGRLRTVNVTGSGVPRIALTPAQLLAEKDVLGFISGTVDISVDASVFRGRSASVLASKLGESGHLKTVQFADGELSFDAAGNPAEVARLYQAAFNRAPDQAGLQYWTGVLNSGDSLQSLASAFIASPEYKAQFGTSVSNTAFVTQLYTSVLHRAPDAAGLASWTALLAGGATQANVLVGFSESYENQANTAATVAAGIWTVDKSGPEVARLYDTVFGRLPDIGGLKNWENALNSGAMTPTAVAAAFTASPEFQAKYGALSTRDFVTTLYQNALHRAPDQAGHDTWTGLLDSGAASRSAVVLGFSESAEHQANTVGNIISNDPANYGIKTA